MATEDFKLAVFAWLPNRGFSPARLVTAAVLDLQRDLLGHALADAIGVGGRHRSHVGAEQGSGAAA